MNMNKGQTTSQTKAGLVLAIVLMAVVITVSNILVAYPINDWLTWAAFTYPLVFLITDVSNRNLGARYARQVIYIGFAVAVLLSLYFADVRIAVASGLAFLVGQLCDVAIFDQLRRRSWWQAPLISSSIASIVDTVLFFGIAFISTGLPWISLATGDYLVKLALALVMLIPFRLLLNVFQPVAVEPSTSV